MGILQVTPYIAAKKDFLMKSSKIHPDFGLYEKSDEFSFVYDDVEFLCSAVT